MPRLLILIAVAIHLAGCASSGPPVSELRQGVQKAVFIQQGSKPLSFSTGVIDTASFWGTYGDGVAAQTGGWLWSGLASSGRQEAAAERLTNAELVERLYDDHPLTEMVSDALMPELSRLWGQRYRKTRRIVTDGNAVSMDPDTKVLTGINTDADLVLLLKIHNINLTERFSMGGALAAGFSMGTHEKSLTTEVTVLMHAFRRDQQGDFKEIWSHACGTNYTSMDTSYYLEELMATKDKITEILDEATRKSIDGCTQRLNQLASR